MALVRIAALACGLATLGCSRGQPRPVATTIETRTAFGTASAIPSAGPGAGSRAFRVLTLRPPDGAVVQVHGIGPFHIHWRDGAKLLDEPGAAAAFHFRKGDEVLSPRGIGRIRQGYASGALVQYEVEGADGGLFMVREDQLRRR